MDAEESARPAPDGVPDQTLNAPPVERRAPEADDERTEEHPAERRVRNILAVLLAVLGLTAAVVAWRVGLASSAAEDANRAGLTAARALASQVVQVEGATAQSFEAFLDYERARRRAEALTAADQPSEALRNAKDATSHWFLTRPEYIDSSGTYDRERQREALLADARTRADLDPDPHFARAEAEYGRIAGLLLAGIMVAAALPLLTLAEVARGRFRRLFGVSGAAVLAIGVVLVIASSV